MSLTTIQLTQTYPKVHDLPNKNLKKPAIFFRPKFSELLKTNRGLSGGGRLTPRELCPGPGTRRGARSHGHAADRGDQERHLPALGGCQHGVPWRDRWGFGHKKRVLFFGKKYYIVNLDYNSG